MEAHDLVARLKDMALSLGRTPLRQEFERELPGAKHKIYTLFRNYGALVAAANLEPNSGTGFKTKIDNSIFQKDLTSHLNDHVPRERIAPAQEWPKIMSISDIHWPFHHSGVLQAFCDRVAEFKPVWILLNGDAWDMYSHSKFPRSHNIFTPREEQERARTENVAFWKAVQARAPDATCVQLLGNHDVRPLKRVLEQYPAAEDWVTRILQENFTFEKVRTIFDAREELLIGPDIAVFHGYRSGLGDHRDYTLMNTINGHTHMGGASFRQIQGRTLWELNSGLAGDPESKGLTYTPQKIIKWTLGWAEVDKFGPRFVPYR